MILVLIRTVKLIFKGMERRRRMLLCQPSLRLVEEPAVPVDAWQPTIDGAAMERIEQELREAALHPLPDDKPDGDGEEL